MLTNELKSHLLSMYLIAMSDSYFDEREMNTIIDIAEKKNISKEEFENIIINPTGINFLAPGYFGLTMPVISASWVPLKKIIQCY